MNELEGLVRECVCGSLNFERVIVQRARGEQYTTDFIACAECRVMYYCPESKEPPAPPTVSWKPAPRPRETHKVLRSNASVESSRPDHECPSS